MVKRGGKTRGNGQPDMTGSEMAGLVLGAIIIVAFVGYFIYYKYRQSKKYVQTNPYVATISLQERYGGLEKKAVSIDELPTEQLILLHRDGKLNDNTVEKLRNEGRLPLPDGTFKLQKPKPIVNIFAQSNQSKTDSKASSKESEGAPKKRTGKKRFKKK
ncbi:hypothetical protein BC833DRAFT_607060 [Globomyces pollinis-pini]|nr:hypothetical protein BC833DRAFT_607060 [Globomyces pollinis-pini]KAJ2998704.1 hypothetical protein HDV02_004149 [Globomyces sp. JEL0801]